MPVSFMLPSYVSFKHLANLLQDISIGQVPVIESWCIDRKDFDPSKSLRLSQLLI